jgi:hypothetical protein
LARARCLALPDLGQAGELPVVPAPLPVSAAALELRRLRSALRETRRIKDREESERVWYALMAQYRETGTVILNRPVRSWSQCVELAEMAWHMHMKEWGPLPRCDLTGHLEGITGECSRASLHTAHPRGFSARPIPSLIEAVLTMGGGQRGDPRM